MAKKSVISILLIILVTICFVFTIPILYLSNSFSTYDILNEPLSFYYTSDAPTSIEKLYLNVDVGDIEIKYIDPPVDYLVKVDVNIEMSGEILAGKSYDDFLYITPKLENINSTLSFTIEIISDEWFDSSLWLLQNVRIIVNIRKDVNIDISTLLNNGDFEITVPYGVSIGNLITSASRGNIFYDFECCTIGGNITGIISEGNLKLKSYNVDYTQNSNWLLNSTVGNMAVEISQNKSMGANITGAAIISTGNIDLFYYDNTADIGAKFSFPLSDWVIPWTQPGFEYTILDEGFFYESNDFPTKNNYNISFYHLGSLEDNPNHLIKIRSD